MLCEFKLNGLGVRATDSLHCGYVASIDIIKGLTDGREADQITQLACLFEKYPRLVPIYTCTYM